MARHKRVELFPAPLREFHEEEWPALAGECLETYACRAGGYNQDCRPRELEACGEARNRLLRDMYPDEAEVMIAASRTADACFRFHRARLNWLGRDHPAWLSEFIEGHREEHELRYSYVRDQAG